MPEVASRSTTAILYIYIYIFVRPSANENPPPSSRFDASILSNGVEEEEEEEEEGLLLYYVVLERGAIERRGATSVDKTRSFRARKLGDSGGREREKRRRGHRSCRNFASQSRSRLGKLGWKAFRVGTCQITILIETIIKFRQYSSLLSSLLRKYVCIYIYFFLRKNLQDRGAFSPSFLYDDCDFSSN